jgi:hypothetical protein
VDTGESYLRWCWHCVDVEGTGEKEAEETGGGGGIRVDDGAVVV